MIFNIITLIVWWVLYNYFINNHIIYLLVTLYFIIDKLGIILKEESQYYNDNYNPHYYGN